MGEYRGNGRALANPIKFSISDSGPNCYNSDSASGSGDTGGDFLGAASRITQVEALNGSTKGLQLLNKTVAAAGPGAAKLVNGGASAVMDTVLSPAGMDSQTVLGPINRLSPDVANKAIFSSNEIHKKIKDGNFSSSDIPNFTRDFANVIKLGGKLFTPKSDKPFEPQCSVPPYAMDLMRFGVKQNYRFLVAFEFNDPYSKTLGELSHAFGVKTCERPNVTFDHEDVNIYNYRTRVQTKTTFQPITMTFYDDQWSQALDFYNMYLNIVSPITNMQGHSSYSYEQRGMDFVEGLASGKTEGGSLQVSQSTHDYAGSFGPFATVSGPGSTNIIKSIKIYHLYRGGGLMDVYSVYNPKIMEMGLDELSTEGGSTGLINMSFAYDAFHIETFEDPNSDDNWDIVSMASDGGGRASSAIFPIYPVPLPDGAVGTPGGDLSAEPPTAPPEPTSFLGKTKKVVGDFFGG